MREAEFGRNAGPDNSGQKGCKTPSQQEKAGCGGVKYKYKGHSLSILGKK
jgi:hypothetical protein